MDSLDDSMRKKAEAFKEEYKEVFSLIKKQRKGSNIDKIILDFLKKQIKEIKAGKRNDLDIGDIFGIAIQHTERYKVSEDVEWLIYELGEYKIEVGHSKLKGINDVEKIVNSIILKRKKILLKGGKIKDAFLRKTYTRFFVA